MALGPPGRQGVVGVIAAAAHGSYLRECAVPRGATGDDLKRIVGQWTLQLQRRLHESAGVEPLLRPQRLNVVTLSALNKAGNPEGARQLRLHLSESECSVATGSF